jgi:hypothetical protein
MISPSQNAEYDELYVGGRSSGAGPGGATSLLMSMFASTRVTLPPPKPGDLKNVADSPCVPPGATA